MNNISNSGVNVNIEDRLYHAIDNETALKTIKGEIKKHLEDGKGSLTLDQQEFFLNTITLINAILIDKQSVKYKGKSDLLTEMFKSATTSSHLISTVIIDNSKEAPEGRQDQFNEAMYKTMEQMDEARHKYMFGEGEAQDLLSLFKDVEYYGGLSVSQSEDEVEALMDDLSEKHGDIPMLINRSNGNCLYGALSTCDSIINDTFEEGAPIEESEKEAPHKRALAVEYMRENGDSFTRNACDSHAKDKTWGEDSQIRALAVKEDRPILVFRRYEGKTIGTLYCKEESLVDPRELRVIVNINNLHYNALNTTNENREDLVRHYHNNIVPVI